MKRVQPHEANLQFEVAMKLREAGIPFVLEQQLPVGRVDIAVVEDGWIFSVIECKRRAPKAGSTFQMQRYRTLPVRVHVVDFKSDLDAVVASVREDYRGAGAELAALAQDRRLLRKWRRPRARVARLLFAADEDLNFRLS
jgi:hypothetical protein